MIKKMKSLLVVSSCVLLMASCVSKNTNNATSVQPSDSANNTEAVAPQAEFSPLTFTGDIKGDNTNKHEIKIDAEGTYILEATSANTGLMFVLQDKDGNNIVDESASPKWTGTLKQGTYTAVVGLTRNAARKANAAANYTLTVKK